MKPIGSKVDVGILRNKIFQDVGKNKIKSEFDENYLSFGFLFLFIPLARFMPNRYVII